MRISAKGAQFIKNFEGKRLKPYLCPAKKWTVGYGHVISEQEADRLKDGISEDRANELLLSDLAKFEVAVNKSVRVQLTQDQFDALVSFVFNVGIGAFVGSTLLKRLNERNFRAAADEFLKWCHIGKEVSAGLLKRRKGEREIFLAQRPIPQALIQEKKNQ